MRKLGQPSDIKDDHDPTASVLQCTRNMAAISAREAQNLYPRFLAYHVDVDAVLMVSEDLISLVHERTQIYHVVYLATQGQYTCQG